MRNSTVYTSTYAGIQIRPLNLAYYVLLAANGISPGIAMYMVPTHHEATPTLSLGMFGYPYLVDHETDGVRRKMG